MDKEYIIIWMLVVICIQQFGEQLNIYNQNNFNRFNKNIIVVQKNKNKVQFKLKDNHF
jgi:hypothetical protein